MIPGGLRLLTLALPVLAALACCDLAIRYATRTTTALEDVIDIQTPATLYAKLSYAHDFQHTRVILLGDSVVYGRRMQEAGDAGWRAHTIPAHIQKLREASHPGDRLLTLNLGMNGALPADIEQVTRLAIALKPACIVCDVSLRAFSKDFSAPDSQYSRQWLTRMHLDEAFGFRTASDGWPFAARLEAALRDSAVNYWFLYRLRDFVQWRLFDGEPSTVAPRLRAWLDRWVAGGAASDSVEDDMMLLLKAKNRHDSITLAGDNPQVIALKRTLDQLVTAQQRTIFFYATEDHGRLAALIDGTRYARLQRELAAIFAPYASRGITYIPPCNELQSTHYIDYGHLTDAGNAIVARNILSKGLEDVLSRSWGAKQ